MIKTRSGLSRKSGIRGSLKDKLTILNQKFQELRLKEILVKQKFDPTRRYPHSHIYIDDLKKDYQEEIQNLGFCKMTQLLKLEARRRAQVQTNFLSAGKNQQSEHRSGKTQSLQQQNFIQVKTWKYNKQHGVQNKPRIIQSASLGRIKSLVNNMQGKQVQKRLLSNRLGSAVIRREKEKTNASTDFSMNLLDEYESLILKQQSDYNIIARKKRTTFIKPNRIDYKFEQNQTRFPKQRILDFNTKYIKYCSISDPEKKLEVFRIISKVFFKTPLFNIGFSDLSRSLLQNKQFSLVICSAKGQTVLLFQKVFCVEGKLKVIDGSEVRNLNVYYLCQYLMYLQDISKKLLFQIICLQKSESGYESLVQEYYSFENSALNQNTKTQLVQFLMRSVLVNDPQSKYQDVILNSKYLSQHLQQIPASLKSGIQKKFKLTDVVTCEGVLEWRQIIEEDISKERQDLSWDSQEFRLHCNQSESKSDLK